MFSEGVMDTMISEKEEPLLYEATFQKGEIFLQISAQISLS